MIHKRNKSERRKTNVELNITAFMNLMVVLVPFLLMTAAFTTTSILDLNLPKADAGDAASDKSKEFAINVVLSKEAITISDHNYSLLNQTLRQIKYKYPDKTDISILPDKFTPYEDIVQVMDKSREFHTFETGQVVTYELFPDISIGDSPAMANAGATP